MRLIGLIWFLFATGNSRSAFAEVEASRCFVGTSAFMLANLYPSSEPPDFYQLNFGYHLTRKDVVSVELLNWRYYAPLGITLPKEEEKYPGHVSARGVGAAYQRFIWRGMYAAVHGAWLDQTYVNREGIKIGSGKQLFSTFRLGYRLSFFSNRVFLEPSFAVTHWPINTGLPAEFRDKESQGRKVQFEPGLHVGFVF